jgi:muramoyltetrapeptide carboxypeptidase
VTGTVLRPPALRPGDRVALVSPAGPPSPERVERGVELLRSWGFDVHLAPHALGTPGGPSYLAAADDLRLADLNAALRDPSVRGVFCTRGGYGTQRLVDRLDLDAVRRDPKVVVGFSDITGLQAALWARCRLVTFHGPGAAWDDARSGRRSADSLRSAVTDPAHRPVLAASPSEPTSAVRVDGPAVDGTLLGGNLSLLAAACGTPDAPRLAGAVLLVEEVGEAPYRVDRLLTQLRRSGALDGVVGVAVGQFTHCDDPGGGTGVVDVLAERLGDLGVPVLGGLPVGHGADQLTVPLGVRVLLDTRAGTLSLLQPGVRPG